MTTLESGNLWTAGGVHTFESAKNHPYEHEYCRNYRKQMREFKAFTDHHPRSAQIPEVKICFAQGNLDGFNGFGINRDDRFYTQRECVFGLLGTAMKDGHYLYGDPEYGWDIYNKTVAPINPGARGLKDLYTYLVKNLLHACRDQRCHITERNSAITGENCQNIFYALYPEEMYALNSDCKTSREFDVHLDGKIIGMNLKPAEFITIRRKEKQNDAKSNIALERGRARGASRMRA